MDTVPTFVLRSCGGIVAGALVAAAGYWIAAVAALLVMHGLPLGSPGGPPTTADVSAHLAFAAVASLGGGLVAARIAGYRPGLHASAIGGLLAIVMFLGFSKPASQWPAWFPYGMAVACAVGAVLAGWLAIPRRMRG